ncbi:DUF255 domain-containing protein, partial [bacterium]|nr:DUF255 domain-containing protein [bacterium]
MESQHTNRLIHATSPYLLQHAHNPVDWYPWGEEPLRKAKAEDKPIFLSIGYSACHWCHVMEEQSFENKEIAEIMNSHFINIKVDREERPDLDEIYMTAVQAMTGSGGWPMSVFLTPELKPFFGGTYFPPSDMYGRPGFKTILLSLSNAYANRRDEVDESAQTLADHIRQVVSRECSDTSISSAWVAQAKQEMASVYDPDYGGFGHAPKFPHSMDLGLLLRYYKRTGDKEVLQMVELTLAQMAKGGMYDQLGGGFHRYSVDEKWLIPHFEKMLYDNALLSKVYLEAYQVTKSDFHQKIAREIFNYILREMTSETGAFYSTQDADTVEGEGAFFAWTPAQIHEVLGKEHGEIVCRYYGIEPGGNFEQGKSVLHINQDLDPLAKQNNQSKEELLSILKEAQCKLFAAREKREKPTTDTKILSDWNGLMISSMAFAANVLQEPIYAEAAEKAADYIMQTHWHEKTLLHTSKNGDAHTNGFLCDYAYLANGLIDLYEANRNPETLKQAISITDSMVKRFWDKEEGAFFFTEEGQTDVIAR